MSLELEHAGYSKRYLRFVEAHREAFEAAYLDQSSASANDQERLRREYATLPPRHVCSCRCPQEARGYPACAECKRLRAGSVRQDLAVEVSSRHPISTGTVPLVIMLDIEAGYAA